MPPVKRNSKIRKVPKSYKDNDNNLVFFAAVTGMNPDGVQFKPFGIHFGNGGEPIFYVELRCPLQHVLAENPIILTPEGACLIAKTFAETTKQVANQ